MRLKLQSSGLQTADGLTGLIDLFPKWLVQVTGKLVLAVSRRPQSLFMGPLHGILEHPYGKAAGFPMQGKAMPFVTLKVIHHFC